MRVSVKQTVCRFAQTVTCPADKPLIAAARQGVCAVLALLAVPVPCRVELWLASDAEIHALNRAHRGVDKPTDVLSFPLHAFAPDGAPPRRWPTDEDGYLSLGSIVVSVETALAQAAAFAHGAAREFAFLTAHSALHLLGFDHENNPEGERRMIAWQKAALRALSLR